MFLLFYPGYSVFILYIYIDLLRRVMYIILICVYFTMYWVRDDLINEFNQSINQYCDLFDWYQDENKWDKLRIWCDHAVPRLHIY